MGVSTHEVSLDALDALKDIDALCLFIAEDERPLTGIAGFLDWRMCGGFSRILQERFFTGAKNDWLLVPAAGRVPVARIFALGVGPREILDPVEFSSALAVAAQKLALAKVRSVALELPSSSAPDETRVEEFNAKFLPTVGTAKVALLSPRELWKLVVSR